MELAELVRARNHLHAAGLDRGVGERDPGGHLQGRLEAEVGGILVPAHIGRVASVLGPDREMEQTNIRTDHVLDGVEDGGDRKSTRLNSSHGYISYAVFCLKKKKQTA